MSEDQMAKLSKEVKDGFKSVNKQLVGHDKLFEKMFVHMEKRFDSIDNEMKLKSSSADMQTALGLLDTLSKRQEISDDERLVMSMQLTRLHE